MKQLLGRYVKFRVGKRFWYGKVLSVEQGVANIKGAEQKKKDRAAYHYPVYEIVECTHEEVFNIGRNLTNFFF